MHGASGVRNSGIGAINLDLRVSSQNRAQKKQATFKENANEDEMLNLIEETNSVSAYVSNESQSRQGMMQGRVNRDSAARRRTGLKSAATHKSSINVTTSGASKFGANDLHSQSSSIQYGRPPKAPTIGKMRSSMALVNASKRAVGSKSSRQIGSSAE